MTETTDFTARPKILSVSATPPSVLLLEFDNGQKRQYDMTPHMKLAMFAPLKNPALFRAAKVEFRGRAVSWSDDIDISGYELWLNGKKRNSLPKCCFLLGNFPKFLNFFGNFGGFWYNAFLQKKENTMTDNHRPDNHRQTVGEWLSRSFEWRIPVYQRHYAWDATIESGPIHLFWETVEEQTIARLQGKTPPQHYLGAVLVDNKTERNAMDAITRYDVVDGQQRLTTISIGMLALIRAAEQHGCAQEIKTELEKYVFLNKAQNRPRLHPTNFDNKQFQTVLYDAYDVISDFSAQNISRENAAKSKIVSTSQFFEKQYNLLVDKNHESEPTTVIRAIMKTLTEGFDVVLIVLRKKDEAQKIFESLNNYAKPLTTFDLIRNNVFYRAALIQAGMDVELFHTSTWQELEKSYWEQKADKNKSNPTTHIQAYAARTLVAKMQKDVLFNRNEIFKTYKQFYKKYSSIKDEIDSFSDYVDIYKYLDSETERNPIPEIDFGVFRYKIWNSRDFYPVIFLIVDSKASAEEKRKMIGLMESYVIRRNICGLSPGHYNKYAASICAKLGEEPDYEALREILIGAITDTTVFPDNERVMRDYGFTNFYKSPFKRYVFEEIEKSLHSPRAERVVVADGDLTIDHILPQGWDTNEVWKNIVLGADGSHDDADAQEVDLYLHTIGNLTLMSDSNNSAKSNKPLEDVKELLLDGTMKLNCELAKEEIWNIEKIKDRSKTLVGKICKIWPYDIE